MISEVALASARILLVETLASASPGFTTSAGFATSAGFGTSASRRQAFQRAAPDTAVDESGAWIPQTDEKR